MVYLAENTITLSDRKTGTLNLLVSEPHDARVNAGAARLSLDNFAGSHDTGDR
jgi:hypothetical protein